MTVRRAPFVKAGNLREDFTKKTAEMDLGLTVNPILRRS